MYRKNIRAVKSAVKGVKAQVEAVTTKSDVNDVDKPNEKRFVRFLAIVVIVCKNNNHGDGRVYSLIM